MNKISISSAISYYDWHGVWVTAGISVWVQTIKEVKGPHHLLLFFVSLQLP